MHNNITKALLTAMLIPIIITQAGCSSKTGAAAQGGTASGAASTEPYSKQSFYFDTVCAITVYDMENMSQANADAAIEDAFALCRKYEQMLSKTIEGSDIWNVNHAEGKPVQVQDDTAKLVQMGIDYGDLSEGCFDITIGKAEDLWDFHSDNPKVPDRDELAGAVKHVNYKAIHLSGNTITMEDPEAEIDLGGIAKGYIADRVAEELAKDKVTSAIISLGGNIECIGGKPSSDGASQIPFNIGIETPFSEMTQVTGSCKVTDGTLVTSGIYERFFEKDGVRYHHILDPKTGYPVENDVVGVTIRSSKGKSADCDALSTTCLILGVDKGMKLIEGLDGFAALFIDQDNQISKTSGMEFTPKN